MSKVITNSQLMEVAGISASYASMILNGRRPCPIAIAAKVFHSYGARIGPFLTASDDEIAVVIRLNGIVHTASDRAAQCPASPGNGSDFTENQETAGDDLSLVAAPGGSKAGVVAARPAPVERTITTNQEAA